MDVWSKECGDRVRKARIEIGVTQQKLAETIPCPFQTISKVERGEIVPRDYLRAAIALRLCKEVHELWPYPSRERLRNAS